MTCTPSHSTIGTVLDLALFDLALAFLASATSDSFISHCDTRGGSCTMSFTSFGSIVLTMASRIASRLLPLSEKWSVVRVYFVA